MHLQVLDDLAVNSEATSCHNFFSTLNVGVPSTLGKAVQRINAKWMYLDLAADLTGDIGTALCICIPTHYP